MNRAIYPVEYDPLLRIFNNQITFYQYLANYNPDIDVGLSALLPPTQFVIKGVHYPCRSIVDFFTKLAEKTGLPIDTKISTIRMGVILLFFTKDPDERTLTLQSGDVNLTVAPNVFKEKTAKFKVTVAEGYVWEHTAMPKKVEINGEQCDVTYADQDQTFTIQWPYKKDETVNLGLKATVKPEPEPEPGPEVPEPPLEGDGEGPVTDPQDGAASSSASVVVENKDEILKQAAALNNEDDKSGSKDALQAFAKEHGVTLSKAKTFQNMMKDFEAALA